MATLEDCVKFAAYHKAHRTPANAASAMHSVIAKLDDMRALGNAIMADFEAKKSQFDTASRSAWEEEQAARIISLFEELAAPLEKLANEERLAHGS